jgi:hypothetical protein
MAKRKRAAKTATAGRKRAVAKRAKKAATKAARRTATRRTKKTVKASKRTASKKTARKAAPKKRTKRAAAATKPKASAKSARPRGAKKAAAKKAAAPARGARPKRAARPAPVRGPIPSSLNLPRKASAARSGREEMLEQIENHREAAGITGGDLDANFEVAYSSGDEAPGGDNPTPDQDVVDEIGHALGIEYESNEELKGAAKLEERDKHRWELDPASAEDYPDRDR